MLYIFLNNTWQIWDYVHNSLGYSNQETETVSFKKADYDYWGQSYLNTGFHDGNFSDPLDGTYWADGIVGWYDINQLALNAGLFPSNAQSGPNVIRKKESGVSTQTVVLIDSNQTKKYLLRGLLELGWLTEEEVENAGWSFGIPIGGVLTQTEDIIMNGTIPDRINIGSVQSPTRYLTSNKIPESGVSVVDRPSIEILFGFGKGYPSSQWLSTTFNVNTNKVTAFINISDRDRAVAFGLSYGGSGYYETGLNGAVVWNDNYIFEPIALYADLEGTQLNTDDMLGFYCDHAYYDRDYVSLKSSISYTTPSMSWKCRITKIS